MIAIFRHQQMRQRGRCGTAAWRRHRWRRSLRDGVARTAGKLRPHVTNDLEVPRHVIQHLGDVLAQPGHAATTVAAGAGAIVGRLMHDLLAWQMLGQRLTLRPVGGRRGWCRGIKRLGAGGIFGRTGLQFLELELELLDLAADPLRRAAELHATQLRDLEPQLLDLQRLQLDRGLRCLQFALAGQRERTQCGGIGRQFGRGERHVSIYQDPARPNQNRKGIGALSHQHWLRRRRRCYRSPPIHRLDQHRKLRRRERHRAIDDRRPDETTLLKTLGDQPHPAAVPIQALEVITAFAAEDEQMTAERIWGAPHIRSYVSGVIMWRRRRVVRDFAATGGLSRHIISSSLSPPGQGVPVMPALERVRIWSCFSSIRR